MYLFEFIITFELECRRMSSFVRPSLCRRDEFTNPRLQNAQDVIVSSTPCDFAVRSIEDLDVLLDEC
jgi:hypothetical protein